jgi:hypothetical protein
MITNVASTAMQGSGNDMALEHILLPLLVAVTSYILLDRLGEWKQRKRVSILGTAILDSLIEEVRTGLRTLKEVDARASIESFPSAPVPLPRKAWTGMTTISDDILLRLIATSERHEGPDFRPRDVRIHCKNYFEFICPYWDQVCTRDTPITNWVPFAKTLITKASLIEATSKVLSMLEASRELLENNAKRIIPK